MYRQRFELQLGFERVGPGARTVGGIAIPLWLPLIIAFAGTSLVWRADVRAMRRAREGLCAACDYDLAGTVAGAVCPECGRAEQS